MSIDPIRRVCVITNTSHFSDLRVGGIVELGAVELRGVELSGREFHTYLNPGCDIEWFMHEEHGLTRAGLCNAPAFTEVAMRLLAFISGADLIVTEKRECDWIDWELSRLGMHATAQICPKISYTFEMYRAQHVGQTAEVIRSGLRRLHGISPDGPIKNALDRARLLARAYVDLAMHV